MTLRAIVEALNQGKPEIAADLCLVLLKRDPGDASVNELAGLAALRIGQAGQALDFARRSLASRPDHVATLMLAGRAALTLGAAAEAAASFAAAAKAAPDRAEPAFLFSTALIEAADPGTDATIDALARRFPGAATHWEDLARSLLARGRREAAVECLARASATAPSFRLALNRGLILKDLGRPGEAAEAFAAAVAQDPASARAWFLRGVSASDAGRRDEAVIAYRRALAVAPTLAEAAMNLGTLLQESGDLAGAKAAYGEAVKLRPETFGRIAQAITMAPKGELWLDLGALRRHFDG